MTPDDLTPADRSERLSDAELARDVADAVTAVPGVARLGGSGPVQVATLHAGGRVLGVRMAPSTVLVHLVAGRLPLPDLVEEVRVAAVAALRSGGDTREVEVVVNDLDAGVTLPPPRPRPPRGGAPRVGVDVTGEA